MLIVAGGIYMASYAPRRPPARSAGRARLSRAPPWCSRASSCSARSKELAWDKFFLVGRWTLLSYVIAAGLIEFAFVKDHIRGGSLAVVTAMLVLFAVIVPLIISFTVARYQSGAREQHLSRGTAAPASAGRGRGRCYMLKRWKLSRARTRGRPRARATARHRSETYVARRSPLVLASWLRGLALRAYEAALDPSASCP